MSTTRKLKESTFRQFAEIYKRVSESTNKEITIKYEICECVGYGDKGQSERLKAVIEDLKNKNGRINLRLYPKNLASLEEFLVQNPWTKESPIHLYILTGDMQDDPGWTEEQQEKYANFAKINWRDSEKWNQAKEKFELIDSEDVKEEFAKVKEEFAKAMELDIKKFKSKYPTFPAEKIEKHIKNEAIDVLTMMEENTNHSSKEKLHALLYHHDLSRTMNVLFQFHELFNVKKESLTHVRYVTFSPKTPKHVDDVLRQRNTNAHESSSSFSPPASPKPDDSIQKEKNAHVREKALSTPSSPKSGYLTPPTTSSSLSEEEQTLELQKEKVRNFMEELKEMSSCQNNSQSSSDSCNKYYDYLADYIYLIVSDYTNHKTVDSFCLAQFVYDLEKIGHFPPEFNLSHKISNKFFWQRVDVNTVYAFNKAYCTIKTANQVEKAALPTPANDSRDLSNVSMNPTIAVLPSMSCRTESLHGSSIFAQNTKKLKPSSADIEEHSITATIKS